MVVKLLQRLAGAEGRWGVGATERANTQLRQTILLWDKDLIMEQQKTTQQHSQASAVPLRGRHEPAKILR